ncbi:MAG: hypothetical protein LBC68_03240, partial [Prevotellaceae bacterium]|nr:hypothetical protein [Prevotellaceae bacterium]
MKHKFNVLAIAMRYCLVICLVGHFMIETKLSAQNQSVIMPNSQSNCAGRGRLLFTEDFGGNDLSDPEIKASGIPQVDGYTYKTNLLGHGTYVIAKQNPVPYPGSWHQLSDHTHPNDRDRGYFLAFDATSAPGQLYEHQIDDLCDGTKLYFSTWIVSLMKIQGKHKGNLMFQIEDLNFKILAQYLTGDIPDGDPVWKNYGFEFTVPNGESSIILRIINNGAGSEGNDLAIDDIEVRFCSPSIMMSNQVADTLCYDQTFQLNASYIDDGSFTNGNNDMVYRWEYSQTSDFKNAVMLDGGIEKSSTINTNITV